MAQITIGCLNFCGIKFPSQFEAKRFGRKIKYIFKKFRGI